MGCYRIPTSFSPRLLFTPILLPLIRLLLHLKDGLEIVVSREFDESLEVGDVVDFSLVEGVLLKNDNNNNGNDEDQSLSCSLEEYDDNDQGMEWNGDEAGVDSGRRGAGEGGHVNKGVGGGDEEMNLGREAKLEVAIDTFTATKPEKNDDEAIKGEGVGGVDGEGGASGGAGGGGGGGNQGGPGDESETIFVKEEKSIPNKETKYPPGKKGAKRKKSKNDVEKEKKNIAVHKGEA